MSRMLKIGKKGKALMLIVPIILVAITMTVFSIEGDKEKPDLFIEEIYYFPDEIREGDEVNFTAIIKNKGNASASEIEVALYVDSRDVPPIDVNTINSLKAGEIEDISLYWIATIENTKKNHTIFIIVDYRDKIKESDEGNNWEDISISVGFYPPPEPFPPEDATNATWWNENWHYRLPLIVQMNPYHRDYIEQNKIVKYTFNIKNIMEEMGLEEETFDPNSTRVIEYGNETGKWIPKWEAPREFLRSMYMPNWQSLIWILNGTNQPGSERYYYIYWDTLENGEKKANCGKIPYGIKNVDFEDKCGWKFETKERIRLGKWENGYTNEISYRGEYSYKICRLGSVMEDWASISQSFKVPENGLSKQYWLRVAVKLSTNGMKLGELGKVKWAVEIDGTKIKSGEITDWKRLTINVTNYLEGKGEATISLKLIVNGKIGRYVSAYWDSCWIMTWSPWIIPPPCDYSINESFSPEGWWCDASLGKNYTAGVYGKNGIEQINVTTVAIPRAVDAILYDQHNDIVNRSLPLIDAGFEGEKDYTSLDSQYYWEEYYKKWETASASFDDFYHSGKKSVKLETSNHSKLLKVKKGDHASLEQSFGKSFSSSDLSLLPDLSFWYNIEEFDSESWLEYKLILESGETLSHQIKKRDLELDGWHKYDIPENVIERWTSPGTDIIGINITLVAGEDGAKNVIYIDDLGYSFQPSNDRTHWSTISSFHSFPPFNSSGQWKLEIEAIDQSGYSNSTSSGVYVEEAANLEVLNVTFSSSEIWEGDEVEIFINVNNGGPKKIDEANPTILSLLIYQDEQTPLLVKEWQIDELDRDEKRCFSYLWKATYADKPWIVRAEIDPKHEITEWDECDNWNAAEIDVEAAPIFKVNMDDIDISPPDPGVGEQVNIEVKIQNIGYEEGSATLLFYIDGEKHCEQNINIPAGGEMQKWMNPGWSTDSPGKHTVSVSVNWWVGTNEKTIKVIKDIIVGEEEDEKSPIIRDVVANGEKGIDLSFVGGWINVSAIISDSMGIDAAWIHIDNNKFTMERLGSTDVYFYNDTYEGPKYYTYYIKARDQSNHHNLAIGEESFFRTVIPGIETEEPEISEIKIIPEDGRQVVYDPVTISAEVEAEVIGIEKVSLYIKSLKNDEYNEFRMSLSDGTYSYTKSFDEYGEYHYYIEAIDNSENHNRGTTKYSLDEPHTFVIPKDYNENGLEDKIEIWAGGNPREEGEVFNVTIEGEIGYIIKKDDGYVYWNKRDNETRDAEEKEIDDEKVILFDSDGNGKYDHYYNVESGEILPYEEKWDWNLITIPIAVVLLAVIFLLFALIRRKK